MTRHTHRAIESTKRGIGGGIPSRCAREQRGKACLNGGNRIIAQCRCGANGTWCPDHGWSWKDKAE